MKLERIRGFACFGFYICGAAIGLAQDAERVRASRSQASLEVPAPHKVEWNTVPDKGGRTAHSVMVTYGSGMNNFVQLNEYGTRGWDIDTWKNDVANQFAGSTDTRHLSIKGNIGWMVQGRAKSWKNGIAQLTAVAIQTKKYFVTITIVNAQPPFNTADKIVDSIDIDR